jgi:hypothetical protein
MPDADSLRRQAAIYDRVAAQCTIPELIGYYEGLARDYRARADAEDEAAAAAHPTASDDDTA